MYWIFQWRMDVIFNHLFHRVANDFGTEEERLIKFHEPSIVSSVNGNMQKEPFIMYPSFQFMS
jgi:hypothetical protein